MRRVVAARLPLALTLLWLLMMIVQASCPLPSVNKPYQCKEVVFVTGDEVEAYIKNAQAALQKNSGKERPCVNCPSGKSDENVKKRNDDNIWGLDGSRAEKAVLGLFARWGEALSAPLRKARDITKQLLSAKESSNSDSKDASKDSSDQVDGTASEDADKDAAPPEEVVLLLVFAKWCPFSRQMMPIYAGVAMSYPNIPMLALDFTEGQYSLSPWVSVSGLPSIFLFRGGELEAKYHGEPVWEDVCAFVSQHTRIQRDPLVTAHQIDSVAQASLADAEEEFGLGTLYYLAVTALILLFLRRVLDAERIHNLVTPHVKLD